MSLRRVEEALAAWRAQVRRMERLEPNSDEYLDAEREMERLRDEYRALTDEGVGPGAQSVIEARARRQGRRSG